jgi:hypothetical protein
MIKYILGLFLLITPVLAHDWAHTQYTPEQQQWLSEQRGNNGVRCCDLSDGDFVEEDIREGHYLG